MFKRRNKRSFLGHAREWVWPRLGWGRLVSYYRHRLVRLPDTSYRIAAGVACGVAVSFTPFLGMHVGMALLLAYILRANLVAAAVGTVVGNPWTFPFIWVLVYGVGATILGLDSGAAFGELIDSELLLAHPWTALEPVFWPMVVGGLLLSVPAWLGTYWPLRNLVRRYRARRMRRRLRIEVNSPRRRKTDKLDNIESSAG